MGSLLSLLRRARLSTLLCVALSACTPISDKRGSQEQQAGAAGTMLDSKTASQAASASAGTSAGGEAGSGAQQGPRHAANEPCETDATRSCTRGNPSRQPLQCVDGVWREQPACNEGQRCETAAGPEQGSCVRISTECIGQVPEVHFCDQQGSISVCSGGVSTVASACGAEQHCVQKDDTASCECATGKVEIAGQCQVAQTCEGGCDPLAECTMNAGSRVCGACRPGYSGDGTVGCTPLLVELNPIAATLTPALSDGVRSYRIHLPLFQTQLSLEPVAADGVEINVNGSQLEPGAGWTSDELSVGEHPLAITLTATNGLTTRYEILVEHTGAQEAFIKARNPDRNDNFGHSLALSGDTLVVGAPHEDGASIGIDGDETSNDAAESGAAYVFVREGSDWKQQAYLKSDRPQAGMHFGAAIALEDDLLLVSESGNDPFPNVSGSESLAERPGNIHVFMRTNGKWSAVTKIASPAASSDLFGYALKLSPDQIFIGAPFDNAGGRNSGAFYTLPRDGAWGPLTKHTLKSSAADDNFGWSFAIEGDSLLVGATEKSLGEQRAGKVGYFTRASGKWEEQQVLTAENRETGSTYGWSVALSGDQAAVGAPFADGYNFTSHGSAFVYQRVAGKWTLQQSIGPTVPRDSDYFGGWVGFASPNTLLISASGDASASRGLNADPTQGLLAQSGAVYFFGRQADEWVRTSFVKADNPSANAWLGQHAAISGDTIAVTCSNENSAAVGVNDTASGSNSGSGAAYVFR